MGSVTKVSDRFTTLLQDYSDINDDEFSQKEHPGSSAHADPTRS